MGLSNVTQNLEGKVARFKGERDATIAEIARIETAFKSLSALRERVIHLDGLIAASQLIVREEIPEWSADDVQPRRKANQHSPIPFGLLGRTSLEILRDAPPEGLRTREIARLILQRFDLDAGDRKLLDKVTNSLGNYLKDNEGDLVRSDGERLYKRWMLIRHTS